MNADVKNNNETKLLKERRQWKIIFIWIPIAVLVSFALTSFLSPKTILDGIKISETTISSLLTAVSIMFGVIFVGFFYFRDKSMENGMSILDLQRKLVRAIPMNKGAEDMRKVFLDDILPDMRYNLDNMLSYNEIFFPAIFVLFSVAILICIAALPINNERFDQFVLEYVAFTVIWFTVGFYGIWHLVDRTIKSLFKIHQMTRDFTDATSKDT